MGELQSANIVKINATFEDAPLVIENLKCGAGATAVYEIAIEGKASVASLGNINRALCTLQKESPAVKIALDLSAAIWYEYSFEWCFGDVANLVAIVFPKVSAIVCNLKHCAGLESAVFMQGLESIGCAVFDDCRKLKSVSLPESLEIVNDCAFMDCPSLQTVFYGGSKAQWEQLAVTNIDCCNEHLLEAKIICQDGVFKERSATD